MKLWHKIFIGTLLLVILAVDITSVMLLSNNHRLMIEREEQRMSTEHAYLSNSLNDYVLYVRLQRNKVLLNEEETLKTVRELVETEGKLQNSGLSLYQEDSRVITVSGCSEETEKSLLNDMQANRQVLRITDEGDKTYILAASELMLEGRRYRLVSSSDITEIYTLRSEQIQYVKNVSIICALIVAGVLLVLV